MTAKGAGIGGEIRIFERRGRNACGIFPLLMHADGAIHAVVDHNHNHRQMILHGSGKFLPVHHEASVPCKGDHHAFGEHPFGADGGRNAIAHRAGCRRQLGPKMTIAQKAAHPDGVIARPIGDDGVMRQTVAQPQHDIGHIQGIGMG